MKRWLQTLYRHRTSLLIAAAGLAVTVALVWLEMKWRSNLVGVEFDQLADERTSQMQELYDVNLAIQQSVNALFDASREVTPDEFTKFLSYDRGTIAPYVAMQYVARVAAADRVKFDAHLRNAYGVETGVWERDAEGKSRRAGSRNEYFPIMYAYPPQMDSLLGFDLGSEQVRRAALEHAARTGQLAMTDPISLIQRPGEWGFLVFAPLRSSREPCVSEEACRRLLTGFSLGVYAFGEVLQAVLEKVRAARYDVLIYATDAHDARPVYAYYALPESTEARISTAGPTLKELSSRPVQWRSIRIAQRSLKVAFVPGPQKDLWGSVGAVIGLLGIALTSVLVVARVRAAQRIAALRESERQRATLLSNLPGAAYRSRNDAAWTSEFVSDGIEALTGYPAVQFIDNRGRSFGDLIVEEDRERVWSAVQAAIGARKRFQLEYRIRDAHGKTRWVWEQGCGVYSRSGELKALEGFVTDITERRHTEEQLAQAQKLEAIGQLTGGMAHDFNNTLAVVIGSLDLALMKVPEDGKLRQHLDTALDAALRGADVTKSLQAVARRQPLEPRNMDVNDVLHKMIPLIRQTAGPAVEVVEALCAGEAIARVDPSGLNSAILNLVINARDAMPGGGRLVIETHVRNIGADDTGHAPLLAPGRYTIVEVADNGVGMSPEVVSRAFEPFFTTKERGKGTGLGLSMVYGFARQSDGVATLYSELGRGTIARLYLPSAEVAAQRIEAEPVAVESPTGHERVLLVDDETALLNIAREWLRSLGYDVEAVSSPKEALQRLREDDWDILLTDVVMPGGMDGITLAEQASTLHPGIRVLLTSGFSERVASSSGLKWRVLEKPYRKSELARVLRMTLDGPSRAS